MSRNDVFPTVSWSVTSVYLANTTLDKPVEARRTDDTWNRGRDPGITYCLLGRSRILFGFHT